MHITDSQVDAAIAVLRKGIKAAEASNQAGEEFVIAAARAGSLLKVLVASLSSANELRLSSADFPRLAIEAEIAKATGA